MRARATFVWHARFFDVDAGESSERKFFPVPNLAMEVGENNWTDLKPCIHVQSVIQTQSIQQVRERSYRSEIHWPSSFLSFLSFPATRSLQSPSVECFSSRGFPTKSRSTRLGRSTCGRGNRAVTKPDNRHNWQVDDNRQAGWNAYCSMSHFLLIIQRQNSFFPGRRDPEEGPVPRPPRNVLSASNFAQWGNLQVPQPNFGFAPHDQCSWQDHTQKAGRSNAKTIFERKTDRDCMCSSLTSFWNSAQSFTWLFDMYKTWNIDAFMWTTLLLLAHQCCSLQNSTSTRKRVFSCRSRPRRGTVHNSLFCVGRTMAITNLKSFENVDSLQLLNLIVGNPQLFQCLTHRLLQRPILHWIVFGWWFAKRSECYLYARALWCGAVFGVVQCFVSFTNNSETHCAAGCRDNPFSLFTPYVWSCFGEHPPNTKTLNVTCIILNTCRECENGFGICRSDFGAACKMNEGATHRVYFHSSAHLSQVVVDLGLAKFTLSGSRIWSLKTHEQAKFFRAIHHRCAVRPFTKCAQLTPYAFCDHPIELCGHAEYSKGVSLVNYKQSIKELCFHLPCSQCVQQFLGTSCSFILAECWSNVTNDWWCMSVEVRTLSSKDANLTHQTRKTFDVVSTQGQNLQMLWKTTNIVSKRCVCVCVCVCVHVCVLVCCFFLFLLFCRNFERKPRGNPLGVHSLNPFKLPIFSMQFVDRHSFLQRHNESSNLWH